MPKNTIAEPADWMGQMLHHYVQLLADYKCRMSPREADRYIGRKADTIRGAIERGEIRYYKSGKGYEVTPIAIAEWLDTYCKPVEPNPLIPR